jgi:ATP-dependent Clp protease ATP-binding subunit ClpC
MRDRLEENARRHFRPEFLNRIDEIVVFRQLGKPELAEIVTLEIAKIQQRLAARDMKLVLPDPVREYLIERGYKPEYGARHLRRIVERCIEDPLAEDVLRGKFKSGAKIHVDLDGDKLVFRSGKAPRKKAGKG